jgi:hypothetical protein
VPRVPFHVAHRPAKTATGLLSSKANYVGLFFGLVSAYSQKEIHGTTQRLSGLNHRRQCGDFTFLMFVMGCVPNCGGGGIPHRAIISSRCPSGALRTMGAR